MRGFVLLVVVASWYAVIWCGDWSFYGPYESVQQCFEDHSPRREDCHYLRCYEWPKVDSEGGST